MGHSLAQFFSMGGYGTYVWLAYGLAVLVLGLNVILPHRQHQQSWRRIRQRINIESKHESKS